MSSVAMWMPVVVMLLAIWFGLLYNNKRLDDFNDLLKSEVGRSESNVLRAIAELRVELKGEIAKLDARLVDLERPRISRS